MEFCRFLRSVKFVVRSLGRLLGRGVIKPNFFFDLSHRCSTTVSLETRNSICDHFGSVTRRLKTISCKL